MSLATILGSKDVVDELVTEVSKVLLPQVQSNVLALENVILQSLGQFANGRKLELKGKVGGIDLDLSVWTPKL